MVDVLSEPQPERLGNIETRRGGSLAFWTWPPAAEERGIIIMYHGYTGDARNPAQIWEADMYLACGLRVYAADIRGHGKSDGLVGLLPSLDDLIQDGLDVAAEVRSRHPNLPLFMSGTSMGGAMALAVAMRADFKIDGAVLSAPMVKISAENLPPTPVVWVLKILAQVFPSWAVVATNTADLDALFSDPVRGDIVDSYPKYKGRARVVISQLAQIMFSTMMRPPSTSIPTMVLL